MHNAISIGYRLVGEWWRTPYCGLASNRLAKNGKCSHVLVISQERLITRLTIDGNDTYFLSDNYNMRHQTLHPSKINSTLGWLKHVYSVTSYTIHDVRLK